MDIQAARAPSAPPAGNLRLVNDGDVLKILDSNNNYKTVQTVVADEEREATMPRTLLLTGDLRGAYAVSPYVKLLDLSRASAAYPHGITITSWYLDCVNAADPPTELNANLKYCTAPTDAQAFATAAESVVSGAVVLVDVLDATTGNSSCVDMSTSDLGSGIIPAAKVLFLDMDLNPFSVNITWSLTINFTANIA
jgi:hypothetical protein